MDKAFQMWQPPHFEDSAKRAFFQTDEVPIDPLGPRVIERTNGKSDHKPLAVRREELDPLRPASTAFLVRMRILNRVYLNTSSNARRVVPSATNGGSNLSVNIENTNV